MSTFRSKSCRFYARWWWKISLIWLAALLLLQALGNNFHCFVCFKLFLSWPAQAILLGWLINCDVGLQQRSLNPMLCNVEFSVGINKCRRRRETLLYLVAVYTRSLASQSCEINIYTLSLLMMQHQWKSVQLHYESNYSAVAWKKTHWRAVQFLPVAVQASPKCGCLKGPKAESHTYI